MRSPSAPPRAAGEPMLRGLQHEPGDRGNSEIENPCDEIEVERQSGGPGPDLSLAREFDDAGHRYERGFLQNDLPDIASSRQSIAQRERGYDPPELQPARHSASGGGLQFAGMDCSETAAQDLGLLRARGYADRQRPREKTGKADETLGAEQSADGAHQSAAAEIEEIDHQEVRYAAQHRRVAVGNQASRAAAGDFRKRPEGSDYAADSKSGDGDEDGHDRGQEERYAPTLRTKADDVEKTGLAHRRGAGQVRTLMRRSS